MLVPLLKKYENRRPSVKYDLLPYTSFLIGDHLFIDTSLSFPKHPRRIYLCVRDIFSYWDVTRGTMGPITLGMIGT